jgi:hypothetical protein
VKVVMNGEQIHQACRPLGVENIYHLRCRRRGLD